MSCHSFFNRILLLCRIVSVFLSYSCFLCLFHISIEGNCLSNLVLEKEKVACSLPFQSTNSRRWASNTSSNESNGLAVAGHFLQVSVRMFYFAEAPSMLLHSFCGCPFQLFMNRQRHVMTFISAGLFGRNEVNLGGMRVYRVQTYKLSLACHVYLKLTAFGG